jgi:hypothetical protein
LKIRSIVAAKFQNKIRIAKRTQNKIRIAKQDLNMELPPGLRYCVMGVLESDEAMQVFMEVVEDIEYGGSDTATEIDVDLEGVDELNAYFEEATVETEADEDSEVYGDENCGKEWEEFAEPQPMIEEADAE